MKNEWVKASKTMVAVITIAVSVYFGSATQSLGEVIFSDDFNTTDVLLNNWVFWDDGEIDTGDDDVTDPDDLPPDYMLVEVPEGSGNRAILMGGTDGHYDEAMRSVMGFSRGGNLRCTLTIWRGVFVFNESIDDIVYSGINGPWMFREEIYPDGGASGPYPSLIHVEAGFLRDIASPGQNMVPPKLIWREGDDGVFNNDGAVIGPGFTEAFDNAKSRDMAVMLRVYLGDQTGAFAEYSTDGGNTWNPLTILTEVDTSGENPIYPVPDSTEAVTLDTRGLTAGDPGIYPIDPNTSGAYGQNVVSGNQTVFVHFHNEFGQVYIDDVVVEMDTAGPAGPSIYFVSSGTAAAPHESEGLLIDRLQNVLGYGVTVVNELEQNVADAMTHDLIFVSESGGSGNTAPFIEEYRKSDVPFIMNELGALTTGLFGPDATGAATADIQNIKILDNNHYITENFSVDEVVEVRTSDGGIFVQLNPGTSEATILAAANDGDDTQGAIVVMEVGDKFEDDVATTARVAFMFPHSTGVYLENYTAAGVELIDRVFTWALGLEPVDVPNPVDQQLWTFFE